MKSIVASIQEVGVNPQAKRISIDVTDPKGQVHQWLLSADDVFFLQCRLLEAQNVLRSVGAGGKDPDVTPSRVAHLALCTPIPAKRPMADVCVVYNHEKGRTCMQFPLLDALFMLRGIRHMARQLGISEELA